MTIILKPGQYQWKETPGGTGWSLLRHDPAGDTQTRMLRYSPTTVVPAARLDHSVQWLITRGGARCGDLELRRGAYCCWPQGQERPAVHPGADGYTVLSIVYGAASPAKKPLRLVPDFESLPWEVGRVAPSEVESGAAEELEIRSLDEGRATAEGAKLWRLQPGRPLSLGPAPRLQEFYVLQGSLRWQGERIPIASYFAFTPGDDRGVIEAENGPSLLFVNPHPLTPAPLSP